jgi:protoheme IX farnesyltransferase
MNSAPDIAELPEAALAVADGLSIDGLSISIDGIAAVDAGPSAAASLRSRVNDFYELTKPRMNFLVLVTSAVGFYMATRRGFDNWALLAHTLVGTAMAAAGASVLNQYVERGHDALMRRTAGRPLPAGRVAPLEALVFGVLLSAGGALYLAALVNGLTATLGVITIASYVFVYTPMKRHTSLCTVVGAVPGAIPPMMGWAAATDGLSAEAWALFGILFFWQMPHFLAIAILYKDDYAAGGFKMLPVVDDGLVVTGRQMVLYAAALLPVSLLPVGLGTVGFAYLAAATVLGLGFLGCSVACAVRKGRADARRLFLASIVYLPLLLAAMMLDKSGAL